MAIKGIGATFGEEDSPGSDTYTTIAGVTAINGPEITKEMSETTTLDAPSGYEQFVPTIVRTGEWALDMNFNNAVNSTLHTRLVAGTGQNYRVTFSDASTVTASGYIASISISTAREDAVQANVTVKISGPVTFA